MSDGVWSYEFDVKTASVRAATADLQKWNSELSKVQASILRLSGAGKTLLVNLGDMPQRFERAAASAHSWNESLVSAAKGLALVAAGVGAAAYGVHKFGDMTVKAFGERAGTIRAYTTLLGDARSAEREFGKAQSLALKSDLESAQVEKAQKALMVAGFRGGDLDRALLATTDLASMASPEERTVAAERVARGFSQIRAKGKLQGEELNQLAEAGLSRKMVMEELGKAGVKGDVEKALSGGKVDDEMGIAAIQRAILRQFGTKKLGEYTVGASGSLSGLISNRDEAFSNQMKSFDGEKLPGTKLFKDSLTELNTALSLDSQSGQNLSIVLQDLSSTALSLEGAFTSFETGFLESFTGAYAAAISDNSAELKNAAEAARDFGSGLGTMAAPAAVALRDSLTAAGTGLAVMREAADDAAWALTHFGDFLLGRSKEDSRRREMGLRPGEEMVDFTEQAAIDQERARVAKSGIFHAFPEFDRSKPVAATKKKRSAGAGGGSIADADWDMSGFGGARLDLKAGIAQQVQSVVPPDVNLTMTGDVKIEVHGSQDPGAVADEVMDRFMRKVGRLVKNPRKETT